jgi:hypothetical protein
MSKSNISISTRRFVENRAKGYCEYCQSHKDCSTSSFNVEHIIPSFLDGTDDIENLAYSCGGCNGFKFTKINATDSVSEQLVSLFNPRLQSWNDHFAWDAASIYIIGKTPVGRATIDALKMNRLPLINLRKAMVLLGIHPPSLE